MFNQKFISFPWDCFVVVPSRFFSKVRFRWQTSMIHGICYYQSDITQIILRSNFTISNKRFSRSTLGSNPQRAKAHNRS